MSLLYECDIAGCNETFKKHSRLLEHKCSHTGERPHKCSYPDCNKSYIRSDHLKRHIASVHERTVNYICSNSGCGRVYSSLTNLKRHMKTHEDALPYKCNEDGCKAEFKKKQRLLTHLGIIHGKKQFHCTQEACQMVFALPSTLKKHMKSHDKKYCCSHGNCEFITKSWSLLRQHIADVHSTQYVCTDCGLSASTSKQLEGHTQTHKRIRQLFTCQWDGCNRSYTTKFNLDQHTKSFHHCLKPYSCSKAGCNSTFAHKHSLIRHIAKIHLNDNNTATEHTTAVRKCRKRSIAEVISGHREATVSDTNRTDGTIYLPEVEEESATSNEIAVPLEASLL